MNGHDTNKQKYKRPKRKTLSTTSPEHPDIGSSIPNVNNGIEPKCPLLAARDSEWVDILETASDSRSTINEDEAVLQLEIGSSIPNVNNGIEPKCPLLAARDSEWVDILQTASDSRSTINEDEAVLQLVECEEGPQMKPLMLMFPRLLEEDPEMVEGMLNKAMSTTEVTKHLVGQKANFAFMKKVKRLIPSDKKWLDSLTENTSACCSIDSSLRSGNILSDYEADTEDTDEEQDANKINIK